MTYNDEQFKTLTAFEESFRRAVDGRYLYNPGPAALQTIHRIFVAATGTRQRFPGGCGTCLRHLIEDAGKLYFRDKEQRIAAANDKRAVELTKEAQGEGPKQKVAVRTTAPKKPANAKKTTKNAKK